MVCSAFHGLIARLSAAALLGLMPVSVLAQGSVPLDGWTSFLVDDSLTRVVSVSPLRWREPQPGRAAPEELDSIAEVHAVLNVERWVGQQARIYMVMPFTAAPSVVVRWQSRGTLRPGRLQPGQRQLVFQGVVPRALLEDTLYVVATTQGRDAAAAQRISFTFEIEVPR